jgi:hypothetical protein
MVSTFMVEEGKFEWFRYLASKNSTSLLQIKGTVQFVQR